MSPACCSWLPVSHRTYNGNARKHTPSDELSSCFFSRQQRGGCTRAHAERRVHRKDLYHSPSTIFECTHSPSLIRHSSCLCVLPLLWRRTGGGSGVLSSWYMRRGTDRRTDRQTHRRKDVVGQRITPYILTVALCTMTTVHFLLSLC